VSEVTQTHIHIHTYTFTPWRVRAEKYTGTELSYMGFPALLFDKARTVVVDFL
jgi:hypothetical protein